MISGWFECDEEWANYLRDVVRDCERRMEIGCKYKQATIQERYYDRGKVRVRSRPIESADEYEFRKKSWKQHIVNFMELAKGTLAEVENRIFEKQVRGRLN